MTTTTTLEPPVRREWVVPALPSGDPAAVRAVARALRELESGVRARQRSAEAVLAGLRRSAWRGGAAMSAAGPIEQLGRDAQRVASALEAAAGELERYAHRLEEAHRHHGWSWKKIAAVAGAVVVGAGVVALTAGLAAPEVAMIEAEVVAAGAAASGAAAAEASAAVALGEAISLVRGVQALTRFVVPRLYVGSVALPSWAATPLGGAAVGASTAAAMDYAEFGSVDARDVVFSALLGYAEGASASGLRAGRAPTLAERGYAFDRLTAARAARARFAQWPRDISFGDGKQLRTHYKHAEVFDLPANHNRVNADAFKQRLRAFVNDPFHVRMEGTWRGSPAVFIAQPEGPLVVVLRPNGEFWTVMRLEPPKLFHLWTRQRLGGGSA